MSSALDIVLARKAASYTVKEVSDKPKGKPRAKVTTVVTVTAPAPLIPAVEQGVNALRQGENDGPSGLPVLPLAGTIDARTFIISMRGAKDRPAKIQAIAAFCGYDTHEPLGSQEMNAMAKARRVLNPITPGLDRSAVRSAQASLSGYVSGMPDNTGKQIQDLLGREALAARTMGEWLKVSQDEGRSASERAEASEEIRFEQKRIDSIRQDLKRLGAL
jgi:hypothetical protein